MSERPSFRGLPDPEVSYASETASILDEFYNPYLGRATAYDRIAGFFSSAIYLLTWPAMKQFILENAGTVRMICSPKLQQQDVDAIREGERSIKEGEDLTGDLRELLENESSRPVVRLLAALVANKRLHLKVARWSPDADRHDLAMFHDKVGILRDAEGNALAFRGSINETFLALSPSGNAESISVYPSWLDGRDARRVEDATKRFEKLFQNEAGGIEVTDLPEDVVSDLVQLGQEISLEDAFREAARLQSEMTDDTDSISLRSHQKRALEEWKKNDFRGILEHATGGGKTITGVEAAKLARSEGLVPVILVPSKELLYRWGKEVESLGRAELCGDGNDAWSQGGRLEYMLLMEEGEIRPIIAILDTAASLKFRRTLGRLSHRVCLIVDEVHRIGSPRNRQILEGNTAPWRLGLSATPQRFGDPEGTAVLLEFFGGVIDTYTLKDGIDDGWLCPYYYDPRVVRLSEEEQRAWDELSARISRAYATAESPDEVAEWVETLIHKRARIAKSAKQKTPEIVRVVGNQYVEGQRWLIYCADRRQMGEVVEHLKRAGYEATEYHSAMQGDRRMTLRRFEENGGILVAINCLDEGVDIPDASHAVIAASSRNPRQFIQRRGRVLRTSPGKTAATIIDILVVPRTVPVDRTPTLVLGEIARATRFAKDALNSYEARRTLLEVLQEFDLEAADNLVQEGYEADGEE